MLTVSVLGVGVVVRVSPRVGEVGREFVTLVQLAGWAVLLTIFLGVFTPVVAVVGWDLKKNFQNN